MYKYYIRDQFGLPRGVIIAYTKNEDKTIKVGMSLCNPGDQFSKSRATFIALARAEKTEEKDYGVRFAQWSCEITGFLDRCRVRREFQGYNVPTWWVTICNLTKCNFSYVGEPLT